MKGRKFLTRVEATYQLGIMDARQVVSPDMKVACKIGGEIFEALKGEILHSQIYCRVSRSGKCIDGFTVLNPGC